MEKSAVHCLLFILLLVLIRPVHASVTIHAAMNEEVHVAFHFTGFNSTTYNEIVSSGLLDASTIPRIIQENFERRNLTAAECIFDPTQDIFDNLTIRVEFYILGSDIVHFAVNKTTMNRIYGVATEWRKFHVNLTEDISLNFTEYLGRPLSMSPPWRLINYTDPSDEIHKAYYCNCTSPSSFGTECYFVMPSEATNVHIGEDMETIVFELSPSFGESLLNSPFLILGAMAVAIIVSSLYRSVRKKEEQESDS